MAVMIRDKYAVRLAPEQREELQNLIRVGKSSARVTARARILLKSDDSWAAPKVAEALDVALGTVYRIKQRFTEEGLDGALWDRRQVNRHRKLDDPSEAHLIALACSPAPEGHDHWTLRLLAGKVVELGLASSMSHEGVRKRLKRTFSSRGRSRSGASPPASHRMAQMTVGGPWTATRTAGGSSSASWTRARAGRIGPDRADF